jgi:Bacteriocin-protection, YdeI or OmpD-Associated/Domain of unknown function (DUF1905)
VIVGSIEITAELQPKGPAAAFVLTEEQVAAAGEGAKRFPAAATINGHRHRTTVTKMRGEYLFGFSKAAREAAQLTAGDTVTFRLELDDVPREVEVPLALARALDADDEARGIYEALAFTHRKEFARWIAEAKKDETRDRRVAQALEMLHAGRTRS